VHADFGRSPPSRTSTRPSEQPQWQPANSSKPQSPREEPEPLLQLLTASHPWVGNTINGSLTAYETTKYYSPAFVRSSAEFVERNIGSPLSNTVGSISRRTGVEAGVRRYLGQRRPSDQEVRADAKRRRVKDPSPEPKDVEMGLQSPPPSASITSPRVFDYRSRAGSQASFDSLPAYDDNRSPKYEERAPLQLKERPQSQGQYSNDWRSQLLITTSGLGAALSESSLRSLKFCLSVLRHASTHVATIANALKSLLEDASLHHHQSDTDAANGVAVNGAHPRRQLTPEAQHSSQRLAARIKELAAAILQTVQSVVNAVNTYTGSALPENAAALVRRQILSIPHRMRAAESAASGPSDAAHTPTPNGHPDAAAPTDADDDALRAGRKWLDFATQSLDMIEQVTLIVGGTISSAERWLDTMGRKREGGDAPAGLLAGEKEGEAMNGVVNGAVDGMDEKR